jgi:hypothetical protein
MTEAVKPTANFRRALAEIVLLVLEQDAYVARRLMRVSRGAT